MVHEIDPTPIITGATSGIGAGLLGWVTGRRQSKAQTALTEVQAAREAVEAIADTIEHLQRRVDQQEEELQELRQQLKELQHADGERAALAAYISDEWHYYDTGGTVPYDRPASIVAIVRKERKDTTS